MWQAVGDPLFGSYPIHASILLYLGELFYLDATWLYSVAGV
jgi:hypothetical protein